MNFPQFEKFEVKRSLSHKLCYTVYEARDRRTGDQVALKVLDSNLAANDSNVVNFLSGARIIKHLNHPNIFKVFDLGNDAKESHYYIATELNGLRPFQDLILDTFSLSAEDLLEILLVIGKTLRYAHLHGLVHGFLNPGSIYIKPDGAIKIDDFGFSWFVPSILKGGSDEALNLARYISPEYYKDIQNVDGRGDIYSLGLVLYELLQGKHPFSGDSVEAIQNQHLSAVLEPIDFAALKLPQQIGNIISESVNRNREQRFQNLKEYLKALEGIREQCTPEPDINPIENDKVDLALEPAESDKYFDDVAFIESAASKKSEKPKEQTHPKVPFLSRKFAFSGVGALFLVVLILFVTNYVPLPFLGSHSGGNSSGPEIAGTVSPNSGVEVAEVLSAEPENSRAGVLPKTLETPESDMVQTTLTQTLPPAPDGKGPELDITRSIPKARIESEEPRASAAKNAANGSAKKKDVSVPIQKPEQKPKETLVNARKPAAKTPAVPAITTSTVEFYVKSNNRPLEANIFLDNSFIGKTDRRGKLEVNQLDINRTFTVKISKEGYTSETRTLTVKEKTPTVIFDMQSKEAVFGTVLIDAVPGADKVYVDDQLQSGMTPQRISLKYGAHKIRLVNSDLGLVHEEEIELKIGQVLRVRHDFTQAQLGKVAVSLKNAAQFGFGYVYVDGKLWHEKHNTTPLELKLPIGPHTIEVRREGFSSIPRDVIVEIEKGETKHVSFTFNRD